MFSLIFIFRYFVSGCVDNHFLAYALGLLGFNFKFILFKSLCNYCWFQFLSSAKKSSTSRTRIIAIWSGMICRRKSRCYLMRMFSCRSAHSPDVESLICWRNEWNRQIFVICSANATESAEQKNREDLMLSKQFLQIRGEIKIFFA